jgi:tRNA(adenine34) deaminase
MNLTISDDLWFITMALEQAEAAYRSQEVPVGAVIVSPEGEVLARQFNLKETHFNPTGHAEILALIEAAKKLGNWRLSDCTLYVTLEPCPMCLAAMVQSRIGRCVFGAYDPKGGALSLGYSLHRDQRLNHQFAIMGGIKHFDCSKILSQFFRERRSNYRSVPRG